MPLSVPGNPAAPFPASVTVPITGDPRVPSSVSTPLTQLADRTAIAQDRLDYLDPSKTGAHYIRRYVDAAALRLSTVHDEGMVVVVGFTGLFVYRSGDGWADDGVYAIKPNDVSGAGRWVSTFGAAYGQPNGIANLNAASGFGQLSSKIPALYILDGVRSKGHYYSAGAITASPVTHADITGYEVTINDVVAGDIITVEYSLGVIPASGSTVSLRPKMQDPGGTFTVFDDIGVYEGLGTSREEITSGVFHVPCALSGTHRVFWQWKSFSGGTITALRRSLHVYARMT